MSRRMESSRRAMARWSSVSAIMTASGSVRVPAKNEAISWAWSSLLSGHMAQRISPQAGASAGVAGRINMDAVLKTSMAFGQCKRGCRHGFFADAEQLALDERAYGDLCRAFGDADRLG